jgi:hypothetical protein
MLKTVKVSDAVGMVLAHDLTRIVPGEFKGAAFRKGHIIREEDIPLMLNMGKEHIFVFELEQGHIHENDAAIRMGQALAGRGIELGEPKEGKVNLTAAQAGLLKVDSEMLEQINSLGEVMAATLHTNRTVEKGTLVAGTRAIPLTIPEEKIARIEGMIERPVIEVLPMKPLNAGMIVTGSEVYFGRIQDQFGPVVEKKLARFGTKVIKKYLANDDIGMIRDHAQKLKDAGADLIVITGGMSVDPDDKTPGAIKSLGAEIITYGTPVLPGAMLMLAYWDGIPVFGLPGCVMFESATAFDLLLPRVHADDPITRVDIAKLGHGGLCSRCPVCTYPHCPLGN